MSWVQSMGAIYKFKDFIKFKWFNFNRSFDMNVNDKSVLGTINRLIATDRLNKHQILQLVNIASISNSIYELEENMKWETFKSKY